MALLDQKLGKRCLMRNSSGLPRRCTPRRDSAAWTATAFGLAETRDRIMELITLIVHGLRPRRNEYQWTAAVKKTNIFDRFYQKTLFIVFQMLV